MEKSDILKLARMPMPFGKYAGRVLIKLPEEYLLWFQHKGFPEGELGRLLALCLTLKVEGLDSVVMPLVDHEAHKLKPGRYHRER